MSMHNWKGKYGPLLIAEIGGNHEGDFEYAKKLTQLAIDSDVDYIKFQLYTGDSLVSPVESEQRNRHFKKFELTKEQHIYLAEMCQKAGKKYTASVWDPSFINWIDPYIPIYKIGSGDLTAYPLLERLAAIGKPLILSTGLSTMEDILGAVECIQKANPVYRSPEQLAILQCTSMYPIPFGDANLNVMALLKRETGLTIGYSDHTEGNKALEIATAMGAEILEFHFTDTREGKTFRDHKVSLTRVDIAALLNEIHIIQQLQGKSEKHPVQSELDNGHVISFRRAVYANTDLAEGTVLSENNLVTLRPNHGIDARDYRKLLGKKLKQSVKAYERLSWDWIA